MKGAGFANKSHNILCLILKKVIYNKNTCYYAKFERQPTAVKMANRGATIYPTPFSSFMLFFRVINCLFGVHMICGLCVVSYAYTQSKSK